MPKIRYGFITLFFFGTLVGFALILVSMQNKHRKLYIELDKQVSMSKQLVIDAAQLELDRSSLTKQSRVAVKARDTLDMIPIPPGRMEYVNIGSRK